MEERGGHTSKWNKIANRDNLDQSFESHTMISEWGVTPLSWPYMDIQTADKNGRQDKKNKTYKHIVKK